MKSRWTTYLLIVVVLAVWGLIAERIFFGCPDNAETTGKPDIETERIIRPHETDTLRCDYPDPFRVGRTKPSARKPKTVKKIKRPAGRKREKVALDYFGSVRSGERMLHIVHIDGVQYELSVGGSAGGYRLKSADADSLYFEKDGIIYSLSRTI